jgi:hypothetical protein
MVPVRSRGRRLARAAAVGGAGALWGLGLARLLAEGGFETLFYTSLLVVVATAIGCAGLALALWRLSLFTPARLTVGGWASLLPLALPLPYVVGAVSGPLAGVVLLLGGAGLVLFMAWWDRPPWLLPASLGLAVLCLYLFTLLPSVGEADTLEFQVVAAKLGVAHPTGYPLYVLFGKLFTLLPLRNVAWRVNLASAVFGAAAVVVVYDVVRRLSCEALATRRARRLGALMAFLAALAFAFSATFWSQALVAEVYTLHNLLVAAILWLLLRQVASSEGRERRLARAEGAADVRGTSSYRARIRRWHTISFLLGLSLTNHLTTALLIPAVALAWLMDWLRDRTSWKARDGLAAAGLFLLGLSLYLFIPLRWPALNDGRWMTLGEFLRYVTGGQFHGALRLDGWRDPTRWRIVGRLLHQPFGWMGLALAAVGVARQALSSAALHRRALAVTGVTFVAFFVYGLDYYVADVVVFLLPAHMILAIWMGIGAACLVELMTARIPFARHAWRAALVALFALVPLSAVWTNLPAVDRSQDRGGYAWGQYALDQPLEPGSAILADTKKFAPLYYLQQVEGVRPDLDMVLLGSEELYQADLRRRLGEGQTVYLARYLPHLDGLYLRSVGPLVEVGGGPDIRASSGESLARLGGRVELLDVDVESDPLGRALRHVTLHWQAEAPVDGDLVVRLRLVDADGRARWTTDGVRPVNGLYPTNAWPPGVPVADCHEVPIAPWLPPGTYSLQVGLFSPFGDQGLTSSEGSGPWVPLGALGVQLPSAPEPLPHRRRLSLGDGAWLTGVDVPGEVTAGAPLTVDLAWRGVAEDERVHLSWADSAEGGAVSFPLPAGMVRSRHTVTAPLESGLHTLRVEMVGEPARCAWLAPLGRGCPLARVHVLKRQEGLATFGDRVLLLDAEVGKGTAVPGEVIPVRLRWRGLRPMEEDYTVFVHLVGPDGRLHGQADSWPVQGSYPTSQWAAGQEVRDPYEVRLEGDAPPGEYRVAVGWYLLETMERLRVLDEAGKPISDSFVVGTLEVRE